MSVEQLVGERRPAWDRLGAIVDRAYRRGPRRLSADELYDLIHLYRDASADLARLRAFEADPALVDQINRLVTRAHAQIYLREDRARSGIVAFFGRDYPRLFRETWGFTFASFLVSALFVAIGYRTVERHPETVADLLGGGVQEFRGEKTAADIRGRFQAVPFPLMSSFVTWNNIKVALTAAALGITFGIGTLYVLMVNGVMLGGFAGAYAKSGVADVFWLTILPHGVLELSAIVIAGGAGLLMGYALWCPGLRTRRRALRDESMRALKLAAGLIPAFLVAGFLEGFVTPSDQIADGWKAGLGIAVGCVFWAYLLLAGHTRAALRPARGQPGSRPGTARATAGTGSAARGRRHAERAGW
jgi:uncharacterized membrane protein SpoIIM required for sporulation